MSCKITYSRALYKGVTDEVEYETYEEAEKVYMWNLRFVADDVTMTLYKDGKEFRNSPPMHQDGG